MCYSNRSDSGMMRLVRAVSHNCLIYYNGDIVCIDMGELERQVRNITMDGLQWKGCECCYNGNTLEPIIVDTPQIWTLSCVPIVVILYTTIRLN